MAKGKSASYEDVFLKERYRVIVLDMDGTLYYQRAMQFLMCLEMGAFAIMHPFSLWKLKVISVFRKIREQEVFAKEEFACREHVSVEKQSLLEYQYKLTADKMNKSQEVVKQIIEEWMFKRPLKYLQYTCDRKLCDWIEVWKHDGKKVVVYSDYPVKEKCDILGLQVDAMYSSDEERIGQMKPSARALEVIGKDYNVLPCKVLVVGDRTSKDGEMAETFGCDYVILKKWKCLRRRKY